MKITTMSVEATKTLSSTKDKVLSKNGAVFFGLLSATSFFFVIAIQSRIAATETTGPFEPYMPTPFVEASSLAVGVPRWAAIFMVFASIYVGSYLAVVATRTFVNERSSIPSEFYGEDVVRPTTHLFLGTLMFAPMFFIGLFLGVLPGAFIAISFCFYLVFTSVEGEDVVEAFMRSWDFSRGNRLPLFLMFLGFLVVFLVLAALGIGLYVYVWTISDVLAEFMLVFGTAAILTFALAIVASAYNTVSEPELEV